MMKVKCNGFDKDHVLRFITVLPRFICLSARGGVGISGIQEIRMYMKPQIVRCKKANTQDHPNQKILLK